MPLTPQELQKLLINRYLHGYLVTDTQYTKYKTTILTTLSKERTMEARYAKLKFLLGTYNDFTAQFYIDIISSLFRHAHHKKITLPDLFEILSLIDGQ